MGGAKLGIKFSTMLNDFKSELTKEAEKQQKRLKADLRKENEQLEKKIRNDVHGEIQQLEKTIKRDVHGESQQLEGKIRGDVRKEIKKLEKRRNKRIARVDSNVAAISKILADLRNALGEVG